MPEQPLISVLLPTYNRASTLSRAIKSVLCQSFSNFELIVIDDGSTDNTQEVLAKFADKRMRVLTGSVRRGVAAARNAGFQSSNGKWIAFLDSDDTWMPEALDRLLQKGFTGNNEYSLIYAPYFLVEDSYEQVLPPFYKFYEGDLSRVLLYGNFITPQTTLIHRGCLEIVGGFDEKLPCLVDWDLWLRLSQQYPFVRAHLPIARLYRSPDSISAKPELLANALEVILTKHYSSFLSEPGALAWHYYCLGILHSLLGEIDTSRVCLYHAIRIQPLLFRNYVGYFASFLPVRWYRFLYQLKWKRGALIKPKIPT